jgi:ABC-type glycerol-3-phosphate transport system substrate-binding protein
MRLKQLFLALLLITLATTILASSALFAQENIVLTLGVPEWFLGNIDDEIFDDFEAAHPGVSVVFVSIPGELVYPSSPEYDLEAYLNATEEYVAQADVLVATNYNLNTAATRAGYFLDLTPLVSTDSELNESDFFPSMWESFQWDQGIWGLPVTASFNVLVYRPAAFDAANVPYPTENWTFNDFADAVRALTQRDENGDVTLPGFMSFGSNYLLRSFLSQGYYDANTFPEAPMLTNPELVDMLNQWRALEEEGVFGSFDGSGEYDYNEIPMTIQQPFNLMYAPDADEFAASLLPGGVAGMDLTGVVLSAGTTQPELAYELAKYLTENIDFIGAQFGMAPARQSMVGQQAEGSFQPEFTDEVEVLIDGAILGALPTTEMRYTGYVEQALNNVRADEEGTLDIETALQEMEAQAIEDLQTAEARRETAIVSVATPVPTPVLSEREIALKVNITSFTSSTVNEEGWDQFIADFTDEDPDVGFVEIDSNFRGDILATAEEVDCFYVPYNPLSAETVSALLSIDPYLSADVNFDVNDVVPGVLQQLQLNGLTYGMPMTLQPEVLWYNSDMFDEAGVITPENGWTVDEFEDTLQQLKQGASEDDPPPFSGGFNGGNYLMMLIAAYGGTPLNGIANPPIVEFTETENVEAMRQVLDLARDGYLEYNELGNFGGGGGMFGNAAIYDDILSAFSFQFQVISDDEEAENPYHLTTYPRGSRYTPVSYGIGSGYISATSQNPDACYRFLSALSERPDLLGGMPTRESLLDNQEFVASQQPDAVEFYRSYFETLDDPNLLVIPSNFGGADQFPGLFAIQLWLYRAFDAYVLEDADLDTELQQAQAYSDSFLECTADIPEAENILNMTQEDQIDYFRNFARCAILVDPELESLFGVILGEDED